MNYANNKGIPFVVMAGAQEISQNRYTLKNMETGEQEIYDLETIIKKLS
jgi:histidyl-tRNA synthetase